MKKSVYILGCFVLLFLIVGLGFRAMAGNGGEKPVQKQTVVPVRAQGVVYLCHFTSMAIKVDGFLDEPAWEKAPVVNFTIPKTLQGSISRTEARVLYNDKYLYVGFKAYDKDICAHKKERDSATCNDDVLEIFIKPDPVLHPNGPNPYYDFEINPLGTVMDAFVRKRSATANFTQWSNWNCRGIKIATQVKGTLNNLAGF